MLGFGLRVQPYIEKKTRSFGEDTKALLLDNSRHIITIPAVLVRNEHQMIGEPDSKLDSEFAELLNSHIRKAVTI